MIRQIRGFVASAAANQVVIDVNGVGYLIYTTAGYGYQVDQSVCFHTHLAVRETALDLYGFTAADELEIFELLLTIPKIGPKSALDIMIKADVATIKNAVISNDASYLTKVSGIGKKTAEKIVMELKDAFDNFVSTDTHTSPNALPSYTSDAIDALVSLGYPPVDARKVVLQLPPTIATANEAVREALKVLGQM